MATTHYEELKQLPFEDEHFANASVGFDLERMEPSFVLHPEVPGRSLTLDIARRLGMPEEVLERAAHRLDGSERKLDQVLGKLEEERQGLEAMREDLRRGKDEATAAHREHQEAADSLRRRKAELLGQGREALLSEIATVRRQVAQVIESMRQPNSMAQVVAASSQLIGLEEQVAQRVEEEPPPEAVADEPNTPVDLDRLQTGQGVWFARMKQEAQVESVDRKTGMVSLLMGLMRTRAPVEQLRLLKKPPAPKPKRAAPLEKQKPTTPEARPTEVRSSLNSLDLRGQRVDEALDALDKFIDEIFGRGETAAFIIHGHGTGALRAAVREHLRSSPYPRHFRSGDPAEGGDGVTVVEMK
mgnify:CR=1 FL=1